MADCSADKYLGSVVRLRLGEIEAGDAGRRLRGRRYLNLDNR